MHDFSVNAIPCLLDIKMYQKVGIDFSLSEGHATLLSSVNEFLSIDKNN